MPNLILNIYPVFFPSQNVVFSLTKETIQKTPVTCKKNCNFGTFLHAKQLISFSTSWSGQILIIKNSMWQNLHTAFFGTTIQPGFVNRFLFCCF